jgi:ribosomal protein S18 acetylase RimI-like enzyme
MSMPVLENIVVAINEYEYIDDFIRLNEAWIAHYFQIEEADRRLFARPTKIIDDGGFIFTVLKNTETVGVCALFKEHEHEYQLARMAVAKRHQGIGFGNLLIEAAISKLQEIKATRVYLLSNTTLAPAIGLYKKYGFVTVFEGEHPTYARCNIIMEKYLID